MARPRGSYKQPRGTLQIECVTTIEYAFRDGEAHSHQTGMPLEIGHYRFLYAEDGKRTRWYTAGQAPKWLQAMIREVRRMR